MEKLFLPDMESLEVRLLETEYFLRKFNESCMPPSKPEKNIEWIAYADAFAMAFVSIQGFVAETVVEELHKKNLFLVVKAIRNFTVHQCVFSQDGVAQVLYIGGKGAAFTPHLRIPNMQALITQRLGTNLKGYEKANLTKTMSYLTQWDGDTIPLPELFKNALNKVKEFV